MGRTRRLGRALATTPPRRPRTDQLVPVIGEGLDPSVIDANVYGFTIGETAMNLDGVALEEPFSISFSTRKWGHAWVSTVPTLTRTMLGNGTLHASSNPTLYVDDSAYSVELKTRSVTNAVTDDFENREARGDKSQLRLQFTKAFDAATDGNSDELERESLRLRVIYVTE